MKLEYKILSVEDEEPWYNVTIKRPLSEYLEEKGFIPAISCEDGSELTETMKDPSIDLILMDFNLAGEENGAELIDSIRELNVFTEVLFYSGKEDEMRAEAQEMGLEGVYYCNRTDVGKKAKAIINYAMDKIGQTNAMRALMMSEVANLDQIISLTLKRGKESLDGDRLSKFTDKCISKIHKHQVDNLNKVKSWAERGTEAIDEVLNDRFFDSSKKSMALTSLTKAKGGVTKALKSIHLTYQREVLDERNTLAHECQDENGCIEVDGCVYTKEKFLEMRKNLIKHIHNISKIADELNS